MRQNEYKSHKGQWGACPGEYRMLNKNVDCVDKRGFFLAWFYRQQNYVTNFWLKFSWFAVNNLSAICARGWFNNSSNSNNNLYLQIKTKKEILEYKSDRYDSVHLFPTNIENFLLFFFLKKKYM